MTSWHWLISDTRNSRSLYSFILSHTQIFIYIYNNLQYIHTCWIYVYTHMLKIVLRISYQPYFERTIKTMTTRARREVRYKPSLSVEFAKIWAASVRLRSVLSLKLLYYVFSRVFCKAFLNYQQFSQQRRYVAFLAFDHLFAVLFGVLIWHDFCWTFEPEKSHPPAQNKTAPAADKPSTHGTVGTLYSGGCVDVEPLDLQLFPSQSSGEVS